MVKITEIPLEGQLEVENYLTTLPEEGTGNENVCQSGYENLWELANENVFKNELSTYLQQFLGTSIVTNNIINSSLLEDIYKSLRRKEISQAFLEKLKRFDLNERIVLSLPDEAVKKIEDYLSYENKKKIQFLEALTEDGRFDYIYGNIICHSPARWAHIKFILNLSVLIEPFINDNDLGQLGQEQCKCSFGRNTFMPDLCFWEKRVADTFDNNLSVFPPPNFIAEVLSKSTMDKDRGVRMNNYEEHGVGEYWMINVDDKIIEQFVLQDGKYSMINFFNYLEDNEGVIKSKVIENLCLPLKKIFKNIK